MMRRPLFRAFAVLIGCSSYSAAFTSTCIGNNGLPKRPLRHQNEHQVASLSVDEQQLAFWTFSFAASHIGMSAVRSNIIGRLGHVANTVGLVGNTSWKLPSYWQGDDYGGLQLWPDSETTGRQLFRVLYTLVSFLTLGQAAALYLQAVGTYETQFRLEAIELTPWFALAVCSNAASIGSLANASPLGLMPGFERSNGDSDLPLSRDDSLKFRTRGFTRITRHPLILPVVPWGLAHAKMLGGHASDWIFFGGLAIYAMAGCAAQDLRVSRQEGSVGTMLKEDTDESLQEFFEQTSFFPFAAVIDDRQSLKASLEEIPWLAVGLGACVGTAIEHRLVGWLIGLAG